MQIWLKNHNFCDISYTSQECSFIPSAWISQNSGHYQKKGFLERNLNCGGALRAISFFSKKSPCGRGRAASPLGLRPRRLQSIFRRPRSPVFRAAYAVLIPAREVVFNLLSTPCPVAALAKTDPAPYSSQNTTFLRNPSTGWS